MKKILIIGGGTGTFTLLSALRAYPSNNSVIVSTADDGGSTGALRRELGVMPMGDIRHCLAGLSYTEGAVRDLFSYRFESGALKGHVVGNIILAALEKITGSVESAIIESAKLLNVRGQVVPVTLMPTVLSATLTDGSVIVGEHLIDEPQHDARIPIKTLSLKPNGPANPRALRLIADADLIILGPGDLYTSTVPNLLVDGVADAIRASSAQTILITNLMTEHGETDGYTASRFHSAVEEYLGVGGVDTVIMNTQRPSQEWAEIYAKYQCEFVEPDADVLAGRGVTVIAEDLVSSNIFTKSCADPLRRSYLRHDSEKTAKLLWQMLHATSPALAT